ncbi:hypothetical protein L484_015418 [Morus notabilis]|uniref:Uncharacterized protein n=1 Tax=Morus notabilis TaxID=981085 RepID=W9RFW5_9ROSA|nr:hypothetical protein L484_015418 [Morus notabilis]
MVFGIRLRLFLVLACVVLLFGDHVHSYNRPPARKNIQVDLSDDHHSDSPEQGFESFYPDTPPSRPSPDPGLSQLCPGVPSEAATSSGDPSIGLSEPLPRRAQPRPPSSRPAPTPTQVCQPRRRERERDTEEE